MATTILVPWHELRLEHREQVTIAPRPKRLRFDTHILARDGDAAPIIWEDLNLRWLDDFLRDGWEIYVGKPLRELMERSALLMTGRANPLPGLTGLNRLAMPGLITPNAADGPPSSSMIVINNYSGPLSNQNVVVPIGYASLWWLMVGRGGNGSSGSTTSNKGAGGGAGCTTKKLTVPSAAGTSFLLNLGDSGSVSTITGPLLSSILVASPGGDAPSNGSNLGAAGGTASGGDTNFSGGAGAPGDSPPSPTGGSGGGAGGSTSNGADGVATANTDGIAATGDGGGSGANGGSGGRAGGGGAGRRGGDFGVAGSTMRPGGISTPVPGSPLSMLAAGDGPTSTGTAAGGVGGGGGAAGNGSIQQGGIALAALLQVA